MIKVQTANINDFKQDLMVNNKSDGHACKWVHGSWLWLLEINMLADAHKRYRPNSNIHNYSLS